MIIWNDVNANGIGIMNGLKQLYLI